MTQRCRYDEQILDFVYGELSAAERAEFEQHLATCASCSPQVASFNRVRGEVAGLPKAEPSAAAMERMTALLMQEAASEAQRLRPAGKNGVTPGAHVDPQTLVDGGHGGKLIEFKPRTVRRVLTHPATGIFAVAAAALVVVAMRPQGLETAPGPVVSPQPTISAATPAPTTRATGTPEVPVSPAMQEEAKLEAAKVAAPAELAMNQPGPEKAGDVAKDNAPASFAELKPSAEKRGAGKPADAVDALDDESGSGLAEKTVASKGKKSGAGSLDGRVVAEAERKEVMRGAALPKAVVSAGPYGAATRSMDSVTVTKPTAANPMAPAKEPPPVLALNDKKTSFDRNKESKNEPVKPPPAVVMTTPPPVQTEPPEQAAPPQPDTANSIGGALAARSRERSVEALENQALGQAPSQAPYRAYASNQAPYAGNNKADEGRAGAAAANQGNDDDAAQRRRDQTGAGGEEAGQQLQSVHELIGRGRCADAVAVLLKLEQAFPKTRGLSEAKAQYELRCSVQTQQGVRQVTVPGQNVPQQNLMPEIPPPVGVPGSMQGAMPGSMPGSMQGAMPAPASPSVQRNSYETNRSAQKMPVRATTKKPTKPAPTKADAAAY